MVVVCCYVQGGDLSFLDFVWGVVELLDEVSGEVEVAVLDGGEEA